jgi:hypothetical protein
MTTITPAASRRTRAARSLSATAATAALLAGVFGGVAAAEDARVNSMSFEVQSPYQGAIISVTSSNDGKSWDTIQRGAKISFNAVMQVDTAHPGFVERAGIWLGKCTNTECANHTRVFVDEPRTRDYNKSEMIEVGFEALIDSAPNAFSSKTYKQQILDLCNNGYADAKTPHQELLGVDASFSVNTRKKSGKIVPGEVHEADYVIPFNGGDHTRHGAFMVVIRCEATSRSTADGNGRNREPHRVKETRQDIDLSLSTYRVPQSGPRGTTCEPLKVTTRIGTSEAGPVDVKLWRQVNGGPITSEQKQMHASALGGAKFGDDWNKFEQFSKTTTVQYKAEILGGTFAPSTPWKSITIHCNGDYAPPQSNANPDNSRPPRQPKGEVQFPPTIVTPPPACGTKAAKVRGSAPCIKVAPLPDQRKQWAEQKRREAAAQKRLAARDAELRRREATLKSANVRQHEMVRRPMHFGRFAPLGGPQRGVFGGGMFRGR